MKTECKTVVTVDEIRDALKPHKPMSVPTLYKYLHACRIRPVSKVRQIPQMYPADAAQKILQYLGFKP
jgi:hypothetical protein